MTKAHLVVIPFRLNSFSMDLIIGSSDRHKPFFIRLSLSFFSSLKTLVFFSETDVTPLSLVRDVLDPVVDPFVALDRAEGAAGGLLGPTEGVLALKSRVTGGRSPDVDEGVSVFVIEGVLLKIRSRIKGKS